MDLQEKTRFFVSTYQGAVRMLEIAGNFGITSSVVEVSVIRNHSGPVEDAAEAMRQSLLALEPVWPAAVALAYNPRANGLDEKNTSLIQGWCQLTSGYIRQAQTLLDVFYASRWHNESARRVPRLQAYLVQPVINAISSAAQAVYREAVGPEYLAEQEEAARVVEELAAQRGEGGFDLTSVGGLAIGLGAGLLGVWFIRRKK